MEEEIKQIANIVSKLPYYQWCKIKEAIDKKYSQASNKVQIEDAQELTDFLLNCF